MQCAHDTSTYRYATWGSAVVSYLIAHKREYRTHYICTIPVPQICIYCVPACKMESELQADLIEALEGIDPLELLVDDPELAAIARDIEDDSSAILLNDSLVKEAKLNQQRAKKKYCKKSKKSNICVVCEAPAKGFYYYGAIVCSSCRAFFKRSIEGDSYKDFLCQNGDMACTIDSKSYHSCQLCRYNLCLKQGMIFSRSDRNKEIPDSSTVQHPSTSLVPISGTSTRENQGQNAIYAFLKDRMKKNLFAKVNNLISPCSDVTITEAVSLEKLSQLQINVEMKVVQAYIRSDFNFLQKVLEFTLLGKTNPIYMNKGLEDYIMLCGTDMFMNSAGDLGDSIGPKDRLRLARGNMPLVVEYLSANRIGSLFDPSYTEAQQYANLVESDPDREIGRKMYEVHAEVRTIEYEVYIVNNIMQILIPISGIPAWNSPTCAYIL